MYGSFYENKIKPIPKESSNINPDSPTIQIGLSQSFHKHRFKLSNCCEPQLSEEEEDQLQALKEIMKEIPKSAKDQKKFLAILAKELVLKTNTDFKNLSDTQKRDLKSIIDQGIHDTFSLNLCKYSFIGILSGGVLPTALPAVVQSTIKPEFEKSEKAAIVLGCIVAFALGLYATKKMMDKIITKVTINGIVGKINDNSNEFRQRSGGAQVLNSSSSHTTL